MSAEAELRKTLEGAAEQLEAARLRLRALVPALKAWRWESRTRALADVLRSVARDDTVVRHASARALRRAAAERWPKGPTRALVEETATWLTAFDAALEGRGFPDAATLLRAVVGVPRAVPLTERDDAAAEVLHPDDAELRTLAAFGSALEAVFSRPVERSKRLPFTEAELDALLTQWNAGRQALAIAWARVAAVDTSGGVERALRRRAKLVPKGSRGHAGPRVLVHATFWSDAAEARLQQVVEERFAPVKPKEHERVHCIRFLLQREGDGSARLPGEGARVALLMLAHELTAGPEGRAPLEGGKRLVQRWAESADALEGDDDWRRLRDALRALTVRSFGRVLPPLYRVGQTPAAVSAPTRLADFFTTQRET